MLTNYKYFPVMFQLLNFLINLVLIGVIVFLLYQVYFYQ
jgi:hypothetical protein